MWNWLLTLGETVQSGFISGLLALVGVIAGGLITAMPTLIASNKQRKQDIAENKIAKYAELLVSATHFLNDGLSRELLAPYLSASAAAQLISDKDVREHILALQTLLLRAYTSRNGTDKSNAATAIVELAETMAESLKN